MLISGRVDLLMFADLSWSLLFFPLIQIEENKLQRKVKLGSSSTTAPFGPKQVNMKKYVFQTQHPSLL